MGPRGSIAAAGTGAQGAVDTPADVAARIAEVPLAGAVFDPACGTGEFLLAAWRASGRDPAVARRLRGLEIDPERARRARARLAAEIGGKAGAAAARGVRTGDALLDEARWPRGAAVVANPPWASLSGPRRARLEPGRLAAYRARYAALLGWPSLHGAFLERIARHVAAHGAAARVLVPTSVCDRARYAPLRAEIDRLARSALVLRLPEDAFPGVLQEASLLELLPRGRAVPLASAWSAGPERSDDLLDRMAERAPLPTQSYADVGVHTGNAASELLLPPGAPEGEPLRQGRDLRAHRLGPASARLRQIDPRPGLRFRLGALERHRAVPILLRQTADRPIAALHRDPARFRNTLLGCTPPPGLAPEAAVAILSSEAAARWHRAHHLEARQGAFPQVKLGHLRALPFPFLSRREAPALHDALARAALRLETLEGEARAAALAAVDRMVERAFGAGP